MKMKKRRLGLIFYFVLLLLPIYWMLNMSLRTNADILGAFSLYPTDPTLGNYIKIFTDASWYSGYINSIIYVSINTVISLVTALPAAYAFSRYSFLGDKHVFFWLLTNRMAPAAVFLLPFFQLYSTFGLIDTHIAVALSHCLFNVPLAVWILEGFMSGIPREIDETAFIDGYSFPRFFITILVPLIRAGIGVTAFFCFMFSWVELLLARTLTTHRGQAHRRHHDPDGQRHGARLGASGGGGHIDHRPGRAGDLVRPESPGQRVRIRTGIGGMTMNLEWMAWTTPTAAFFITIALILTAMTIWQVISPSVARRGFLPIATTRGDRLFIGLLGSAYIHLAWIGLTGYSHLDRFRHIDRLDDRFDALGIRDKRDDKQCRPAVMAFTPATRTGKPVVHHRRPKGRKPHDRKKSEKGARSAALGRCSGRRIDFFRRFRERGHGRRKEMD